MFATTFMCANYKILTDFTPAALAAQTAMIGSLEKVPITLGTDEDLAVIKYDEIFAMLRSGSSPVSAKKEKMTQNDDGEWVLTQHNYFFPIASAGSETLDAAFATRNFQLQMKPTIRTETGSIYYGVEKNPRARAKLETIGDRFTRWFADSMDKVEALCDQALDDMENRHTIRFMPRSVVSRTLDKFMPFYVLAELAGGDWRVRVDEIAGNIQLFEDQLDMNPQTQILIGIAEIVAELQKEFYEIRELHTLLIQGPDKKAGTVWDDVTAINLRQRGRGTDPKLSQTDIQRTMSKYGLKSARPRQEGARPRGYYRDDLIVLFKRHLTPDRVAAEHAWQAPAADDATQADSPKDPASDAARTVETGNVKPFAKPRRSGRSPGSGPSQLGKPTSF